MITYKLVNFFHECSNNPVGEQNVELRVCRFCRRSISDGISFNHISHAISESLGNKHIFTLEECDECNQKFSNLEQHITNFLGVMLYTYGIEGKKSRKNPSGLRKLETPEYGFAEEGGVKTIHIKKKQSQKIYDDLVNSGTISFQAPLKFDKFVPLNVYKSFCKFALCLFNKEDLPHFKSLVNWVTDKVGLPFEPKVLMSPYNMPTEHPKFAYFTQEVDKSTPCCIGMFFISNLVFLVEFPTEDNFNVTDVEQHINPLNGLAECLFPNHKFDVIDLSNDQLVAMTLNFELNIPKEMKEGKDYFILNSKEEINSIMNGENLTTSN
jgi:hypothetical protein